MQKQSFPVGGGGVESFRTGRGVVKILGLWGYRFGALLLLGGVSTPLHTMAFSNKSSLCNWMHAASKIFVKTYLKAIRGTFFSNMWNFPI